MSPCPERRLRVVALLPLLLAAALVLGQSRKELEKRRDALDKQIRTTTALIEQARKEQRVTQEQLALLESQIAARSQLIRAMDGEVRAADDRIRQDEEAIAALRADLEALKQGYARMIAAAYRNRSAYDRLSYLFASSSFQQAFRRSRHLNQLAAQRRRQAALISETRAALNARVDTMRAVREEKALVLSAQMQEKRRLDTDRAGQQQALTSLRKEESRLRETQKKQERQRKDLESAIRKAIADAMPKPKPAPGAKPGAPVKLDVTLTPEARELNTDFEKNKGKLPWPVEKGVITGRFGKQPHPVLKGIVIDNNGIDITTEKGASVRAVFRGEVTSVIVLPGAGKAVILSHGAYRTVYSNLASVSATKGQKVDTKQSIGTVLSGDEGPVAHIEVWKITADGLVNVDPSLWIYRE